ncbi:hypothetical protein LWI29_013428 [Acer saccharum]|uniref:Plasma membrane-associated cation-binding protein 1 n=1 Tax=Acer saccharum TaxID=4024 RepID=A0AA39RRL5_ACESA|nr:hypothetical protein LWI29_013428 [Acer saccharum]KAK1557954.1 hypothetical protein Q3G72_034703 [Acer saccharum]
MGYWKSKVLPKIKKVFEKNSIKKSAAAEACKSFDDSKEEINKEFEEKKVELQPKVTEIYEASSTEIKTLVKEPKEAGLKKHSVEVHKFLEELVKIEFPGSKPVSEASSKYGAALIPGPVFFVFEKVSTFIVTEEKPAEEAAPPAPEAETKPAGEGTSDKKEREIVIEEEKKEEIIVAVPEAVVKTEPTVEEKAEPAAAPPAPTEPAKEEPPKP